MAEMRSCTKRIGSFWISIFFFTILIFMLFFPARGDYGILSVSMKNAMILPETVKNSDNLRGYCNATGDEDAEIRKFEYKWYNYSVLWVNGTVFKEGSISSFYRHTCGIRASDGRVLCWGSGDYGQLGDGDIDNHETGYPNETTDTSAYISVSAGEYHTCGIRANDSRVLCWGRGTYGRLGDGETGNHEEGNPIPTTDTNDYLIVSAGGYHTCGIRANDSRVLCWGDGGRGQLGDSDAGLHTVGDPNETIDTSAYITVSTGKQHTCGVRASDGRVLCWGSGDYGQLGDGDIDNHETGYPNETTDTSAYISVSAGEYHTCGIRANDSRVLCWGDGNYGRLGDGKTNSHEEGNPILTTDSSAYSSVITREYHTCGIRANDSRVLCWGRGYEGQLGDGDTDSHQESDPKLTTDTDAYIGLSGGEYHTCGIRANDSRVLCWGQGNYGQLGDGNTSDHEVGDPNVTTDTSEYSSFWPNKQRSFIDMIDNSYTTPGESWILGCRGYNGTEWSSWMNSSSKIITDLPAVRLPLYSNATQERSSDSLTLNVSVTGYGATPETCTVYVEGQTSNQTIPYFSGWCNGSVSLSGSSERNSTIYAYANDSAGQYGLNDSYVVWIDDTGPDASFGTNPGDGNFSKTGNVEFEIKCSDGVGADTLQLWGNWSGGWKANRTNSTPANDSWWNVTVNGIAEGTWKWGAYCNDSVGNGDWSGSNRTLNVDITNPQVGTKNINESGIVQVGTSVCLNVSGVSDANLDSVWASVTLSNGSDSNLTMSDTGSCAGPEDDGWYSVNVVVGDSGGVLYYNVIYANDSSGRVSSNATAITINAGNTYHQPEDTETSQYDAWGSSSGNLTDGNLSHEDENITYNHSTWGRRLMVEALFSQGEVNMSLLKIDAASGKTAVNLSGVTGTGSTHTIFVPNNLDSGVYICPDAENLSHVNQSCPNIERFSYSEASAGTTKNGITVDIDGSDYTISGLSGSGAGENSYLEVEIISPIEDLNVAQNTTFTVNATVYCRNGTCGNVSGTVRYNGSSANPDTSISTTPGDKPFYITSGNNPQNCSGNPLDEDEYCNLTWAVNVTGDAGKGHKIGVLFDSNITSIGTNHTGNNTVTIVSCILDITLQWSSVSFGTLTPGDRGNASGNENDEYNVTVEPVTTCNVDLYINGSDLENQSLGYEIGVGNISWSNSSNDYGSSHGLGKSWDVLWEGVAPSTNKTSWYWIDIPTGIASGIYTGSIEIKGVEGGESP